jgi:glycosyltransferase involved in cell wall biosynthesis
VRIGINATFASERHNGTTTFVDGILRCLRAHGHEALVYSSSERYALLEGVTLRKTPASLADGRGSATMRRFAWMQACLPRRLKRDGVELFFAPNVEALLWSPVPQIVTVHDLIPLFYPAESPRQRHYYKYVLPHILRASLRTLVVSQHTRRDVIQQYGLDAGRVNVVYNSLREDLLDDSVGAKPEGLGSCPYFLFVGTFSPRKNLETVIRAFARTHSEVPEKLVVVAYPDRWQDSIRRLAKELGVLQKVEFYSGLKNAELKFLYRNATALFLLSEYEGFGYPPLEAMASGTPAIVSDSTSLAEVVGDAGIQLFHRDADGAAVAMRRLSGDSTYRDTFRDKGKLRAGQFRWLNRMEQIGQVLISPLNQTALHSCPLGVAE